MQRVHSRESRGANTDYNNGKIIVSLYMVPQSAK